MAPESEWTSTLRWHWQSTNESNRQKALQHLKRAQSCDSPEGLLHDLQEGLKALEISRAQIVKLILIQYLTLISTGHADPLKNMVSHAWAALESLEVKHTRPGRTKRTGGKRKHR